MSVAWVWAALAAGSLLLHPVLRRRFGGAVAALTLTVLMLGTFALDLAVRLPLVSGALAFALAALALFVREQERPLDARRALAIGAAAGLASAGHAPSAALALLALPRRGESWWPAGLALAAAAGVFAVARALGGGGPLPTGPWEPTLAVFGSRQGLLHLTPALWLGVPGLVLMARRDARAAAPLAAAAVGMVLLHAGCPASASASCAREQLAALLPLLAPPIALALATLGAAVRRAPRAPLWAAGALMVCSNFLFMQQYATDMVPRDFPVPFAQVARNQAALVARAAGAPLSWPANWLFAARHGTGPERFDAAAGKRLEAAPDGSVTVDVGRLDVDEALLLEGWSVRHPCGAAVCRAVEGRARLLVPAMGEAPPEVLVRTAEDGALGVEVGAAKGGLRAVTLRAAMPGARVLVDEVVVRPRRASERPPG